MAEEGKEVEATKEVESPGLSLRDALEVGIQAHKEPSNGGPETKADAPLSKAKSREAASETLDVSRTKPSTSDSKEATKPLYNPPGEWTKEEQEDFRALSPKQQEATLRLYKSRSNTLSEIRREAGELQWAKDIVKEITPFLKTRGDKEPTHAQVIKALKVINEIDTNGQAALVEIAKAKGIKVPKEWEGGSEKSDIPDEKITPLQKEINELKSWKTQQEQAAVGSILGEAWNMFESTKNAAGTPKFPEANNTEAGIRLASNIGTLVGGQTELSKQFIAMVKARIPNATYVTLMEEAYRYCGGKVDDSEAPKTQDPQKHIAKSSRAASSVPGGRAQSASNGTVKKFKSYREAAAAALADIREREGA